MKSRAVVVLLVSVVALMVADAAAAHTEVVLRQFRVAAATLRVVVTPATGTDEVGTPHTVTATVTNGDGVPVQGADVVFTISGTNAGTHCDPPPDAQSTNAAGQAFCTFTGAFAGTDTITVNASLLSGGVLSTGSGSAQETWTASANITKTITSVSRTAAVTYDWALTKSAAPPSLGTLAPGDSAPIGYTVTATRTESSRVETGHVSAHVCITNNGAASTGFIQDVVTHDGVTLAGSAPQIFDIPAGTSCHDFTVDFSPVPGANDYDNEAGARVNGETIRSGLVPFTLPSEATVTSETDAALNVSDNAVAPAGFSFTDGPNPYTHTFGNSGSETYSRTIQNDAACSPTPSDGSATISNTAVGTESDTQTPRVAGPVDVAVTTPPCISATKSVSDMTNTQTVEYDYSIAKTPDKPVLNLDLGQSTSENYTLVATRTVDTTTSGASVSGQVCVTNESGVTQAGTIVDQVEHDGTPVPGATQTLTATLPVGETCVDYGPIAFAPPDDATSGYTNTAAITAGPFTATAASDFTLPPPTVNEVNPTASIRDVLTCPSGLSCSGSGGGTFTVTQASQSFTDSYTITNNSVCMRQETVDNTATISGVTQEGEQPYDTKTAHVAVNGGSCLSATKTAAGRHTRVYDWSLQKSASPSTLSVGNNKSAPVTYTLTATRTKTADIYTAEGQICVTNHGTVDATGVTATDYVTPESGDLRVLSAHQQAPESALGNSVVDFGTVPEDEQKCVPYTVAYAPGTSTSFVNNVDVTSANAGSASAQASFNPDATSAATDSAATLSDTLLTCAAGFLCGVPSKSFPIALPQNAGSAAESRDNPYTETVTYSRTLTDVGCGGGTVSNEATLVESGGPVTGDDTGGATSATQTRTALANVVVTGPACVEAVHSPASAPQADVALTKTAAPTRLVRGGNVTYTETVTNRGPARATNVRLVDQLPSGLTLISASATQGGCTGTSSVTCTLGSIAAGASVTITVVTRTTTTGALRNSATAAANEIDPDATNNNAFATITVTAPFKPAAHKTKRKKKPRHRGAPRFTGAHHHR